MWTRPARGRFTSDFGPRTAPTAGASTFHRGVDIAPPKPGQVGVDVVAAGAGVVLAVGHSTIRGYWLAVRHGDGTTTRYQHLAGPAAVATKAKVSAGQRLGEMGATGVASGVHLHFETTPAGADWSTSATATNPEPFMVARGVDLRTDTPAPTPTPTPATPEPTMLLIHHTNGTDQAYYVTDGSRLALVPPSPTYPDLTVMRAAMPTVEVTGPTGMDPWLRLTQQLGATPPADVDESELAAALVPMLTVSAPSLDDATLARIARAAADEQDRRARARLAL